MKLAMILDKRRCYACHGCAVACKVSNGTPPGTFWTKTLTEEIGTFPDAHMEYLPLMCNHCDNAPCIDVCPTGASHKREDGTVQITLEECIGCQLCMEACPYDARYFSDKEAPTYWAETGKQDIYEEYRFKEHPEGTVNKCTFCEPRREKGLPPACVATCAGVARIFGDLDDPESEISKMFKQYNPKPYKPEEGTEPRVFYIG